MGLIQKLQVLFALQDVVVSAERIGGRTQLLADTSWLSGELLLDESTNIMIVISLSLSNSLTINFWVRALAFQSMSLN